MSKVSKLVIKACSDNKFSSFTGEFITSINPENLVIKSAVSYHVPEGMTGASLLKYRGSPPKLLSFSLLFDNTGIIPGSNAIAVMEQVKQLQDVAYSIHKKNNTPNYIRIIWGQIDFKGRLVDLDIIYSMFQVDGTLVRAEAHISVLEEPVPLGKGKSAAGVDSNYAKASGTNATQKGPSNLGTPSQKGFAATPDSMDGPYSSSPPGAYAGGPDQVYHGSNGSGGPVYGSTTAASPSPRSASSVKTPGSSGYDSGVDTGRSTSSYTGSPAGDHSGSSLNKGGVAGNGPGGSGGGVGGGGHGPGSGTGKSGSSTAAPGAGSPGSKSGGSSAGAGSGPAGSEKSNVASGAGGVQANGKDSGSKMGKMVAAGATGSAVATAVAAKGADSLRKLSGKVNLMEKMKEKVSFWRRLKNFAKKVSPKGYEAGKKLVKKL